MAKNSSGAESEYHIVAVRLRVTGAGNLKLSLSSLNDVQTQNLIDMPMSAVNRIEPTRLANFQSQRTRLTFKTTEINETFKINRILIFAKAVSVEYPM